VHRSPSNSSAIRSGPHHRLEMSLARKACPKLMLNSSRPQTPPEKLFPASARTWSPTFMKARRQSMSLPHDYTPDLGGIKAPTLLIHGRYNRMVTFEVSIAILNRMPIGTSCSTLRHWPPFEKPAKW